MNMPGEILTPRDGEKIKVAIPNDDGTVDLKDVLVIGPPRYEAVTSGKHSHSVTVEELCVVITGIVLDEGNV